MKSPSTLIPILEKAVQVCFNINKASNLIEEHNRKRMFHMIIYNSDIVRWNIQRIAINEAIIVRLTAYYVRLIKRATIDNTPLADLATNDNNVSTHSINI